MLGRQGFGTALKSRAGEVACDGACFSCSTVG